jgi:hypothetical protein
VEPVVKKDPVEPAVKQDPVEPAAKNDSGAKPVIAEVTYTFKSTPETSVMIDGKPRGTTPLEADLKPGKHTVTFIDRASGQKHSKSFVAKANKPDTIEWTMPEKNEAALTPPAEKAKGSLDLWCTPICTAVKVDGKPAQGALSHYTAEVPEGHHAIEFILEGKVEKRDVELKSGGAERVEVIFGP